MTPEELVARLQNALCGWLSSAVLYGSPVAGDFVSGTWRPGRAFSRFPVFRAQALYLAKP